MAALAMLMLGIMSACTEKSPYPGYQKSATGLYYQFFNQNKDAAQPQVGDLMDLAICCTVNDTTFIVPNTVNTLPLEAPLFAGDFYEGMAMMHKGDSASFIVNIDSTFIKWFHQTSLPAEFNSTDVMRFEVRLDDFYPESEYAPRLAAKIKKDIDARIEKMKADHPEETATERGEPISFPLGVGQVIPGWDEGIMMMSKGEKGVLYIPYYLAYGDRQAGDKITPFSNLMFEVELVDFQ